jgi:hypothetical protein
MTETEQTEGMKQEELEMILFAIALIVAILIGYRRRDQIKKWFNDVVGKLN